MTAIKRFGNGDNVRIPADNVRGTVIKLGIGLGNNTPERLKVKVSDNDVRDVFANACELVEAASNDPTLAPDVGQDEDDELDRLTDPNVN